MIANMASSAKYLSLIGSPTGLNACREAAGSEGVTAMKHLLLWPFDLSLSCCSFPDLGHDMRHWFSDAAAPAKDSNVMNRL